MATPTQPNSSSTDRAISPVIGVILMVSLAVMIATVIGGFVMDMGDDLSGDAPRADFSFEYNASADVLDVVHEGGDSFSGENTQRLLVKQTGSTAASETWAAADGTGAFPVTAGDQFSPSFSTEPGDEIRVIWTAPDGKSTQTLATFTIP